MRQALQRTWNQAKTAIRIREMEDDMRKREVYLKEQILALNSKMDLIIGLLENTCKTQIGLIGDKLDEGIKIQSENNKGLIKQVRELDELLKKIDDEGALRQEKEFENLRELMKLILANELIKPMVSELGER